MQLIKDKEGFFNNMDKSYTYTHLFVEEGIRLSM